MKLINLASEDFGLNGTLAKYGLDLKDAEGINDNLEADMLKCLQSSMDNDFDLKINNYIIRIPNGDMLATALGIVSYFKER